MEQNSQRHLKRLALAGRWDEVRACLQEYLAANPQDTEALAEWERLNKGEPMLLTLSAAEKRKQEAKSAKQAIEWLMDDHPAENIRLRSKNELEEILGKFSDFKARYIRAGGQLTDTEKAYHALIKQRMREYSGRISRRLLWQAALVVGSLSVIGALCYSLRAAAYSARANLKAALAAPVYDKLSAELKAADGGLNKFFCPSIAEDIRHAERLLKEQEKKYALLHASLSKLESGKKSLTSLSPDEICDLETKIEQSPLGREQLLSRWQQICRSAYQELIAHKAEIQRKLERPIEPMPDCSGDLQRDYELLNDYKNTLTKRLKETQSTSSLYDISTQIDEQLSSKIDTTEKLLAEIRHLRFHLKKLAECRGYEAYRRQIEQINPQYYKPGHPWRAVKPLLPDKETLALQMAVEGELTPALMVAAGNILVKGEPSFPPAFPATANLLRIPEDILTAPSLHNKVYTLRVSDKETWYSTIQPELDATNYITFRRSSIDPHYSLENNFLEFRNDGTYPIGEIDASVLLKSLQISGNNFFINQNIPRLLTRVLNFKEGKHPALAQACIYLCLLKVADAIPYPLLNGVSFSPTLKAHSRSFIALCKRHKIELRPGCWLSDSAAVAAAEQAFAEWFRNNRGADYAAEMAQNFLKKYSVAPQLCGMADTNGEWHCFHPVEDTDLLWYFSENGLRQQTTPQDRTGALPLSPLLLKRPTAP